jgi:Ca-activated chloride channel family protein
MVRPAFVLWLVLAIGVALPSALPAHAAGAHRTMGMYPTATVSSPAPPLPMLDSQIEVRVTGPIVETVVTQRFHNHGDRAIEATYIFPLPPDAAVTAMSIRSGTRTIHAAIEKREEALERYEAAVRAGVAAAVLDQERPDVFTQTVSAIPPRSTVEVVLRYDTLARYSDGLWTLVVPLVVAPRYVPGTASGRPTTGTGRAPDTDRAPDASRVTPHAAPRAGGATTISLAFSDAVTDVTSPTHDVTGSGGRFTLVDPHSDRDAVIRWRTAHPASGWVEDSPDGGYAAVVVTAAPPGARKRPVRLALVLHGGATMLGDATIVGVPLLRALQVGLP